jgi:hypothetical protein
MEAQEIFDTVAKHLLKQGRRATDPDGGVMCSYRGACGTKCAVGVLIPDELYDAVMEGKTLSGLLSCTMVALPDWMMDHRTLLGWLQDVHDLESNWRDSVTMKLALRHAANACGVNADVLNNLRFAWETKVEEV